MHKNTINIIVAIDNDSIKSETFLFFLYLFIEYAYIGVNTEKARNIPIAIQ